MIYTRKKNPKILDFFCRKKWNFRGVLLAKKKRGFLHKTKKKRLTENREKMWKNFCRPPNVFWRLIRHYRPLGKNPPVFESPNHDIWVKKWKNSGKFSDFFLVSAEISAVMAEKQHLLKNFSKCFCSINERISPESIKIFPFIQKKLFFLAGLEV